MEEVGFVIGEFTGSPKTAKKGPSEFKSQELWEDLKSTYSKNYGVLDVRKRCDSGYTGWHDTSHTDPLHVDKFQTAET